jgi:Mg-chelatase subunit ChlD
MRRAPGFYATLLCLAMLFVVAPLYAQSPVRLRVVVVLDASLSMRDNDPDQLARLAARLLVDLTDSRDRVTLVSFGTAARTVKTASGADHDGLSKALDGVVPTEKCTDYGKGLAEAVKAFSGPAPKGERRLVVFLTDGELQPAKADTDGCTPKERYETMRDAKRDAVAKGIRDSASALKKSKAKIFVIGLGAGFDKAKRSRALLDEIARGSGGSLLLADDADKVPEFFADVFAALVGAAVEKPAAATSVELSVPDDTDELSVVVRGDEREIGFELTRDGGGSFPFGLPADRARGPVLRLETGKKPRGYSVYSLKKPESGKLKVRRVKGTAPLRVWSIADAGTSLRIEGVPSVLAEGATLRGKVALRSRNGKPVPREPAFLSRVAFSVELSGTTPLALRANGRDEASFLLSGGLSPRDAPYVVTAAAMHDEGFLEVDPARHEVRVIHQVPLELETTPIRFDTMAEEGPIPLLAPAIIRVRAPPEIPVDFHVQLSLPDGPARSDLRIDPPSVTFGPGKPREVALSVSFADPRSLRGVDRSYTADLELTVSAEQQALLKGSKQWKLPVQGTLRSWTLGRWLREYRWQIGIGTCVLLLLIWAIGRAVASRFPPKARIYSTELDTKFESDSLIKRHSRVGAYRSARFKFPLGKKARPLCLFVAQGSGFEIRPQHGTIVKLLDATPPEEKRTPFKGRWDERYQLGDRYSVKLTRS